MTAGFRPGRSRHAELRSAVRLTPRRCSPRRRARWPGGLRPPLRTRGPRLRRTARRAGRPCRGCSEQGGGLPGLPVAVVLPPADLHVPGVGLDGPLVPSRRAEQPSFVGADGCLGAVRSGRHPAGVGRRRALRAGVVRARFRGLGQYPDDPVEPAQVRQGRPEGVEGVSADGMLRQQAVGGQPGQGPAGSRSVYPVRTAAVPVEKPEPGLTVSGRSLRARSGRGRR